jgi:ribosomal-protein-alanine N-acetyltransferase
MEVYMNLKISRMTLQDLYNIQDILFSDFDDFWTISSFEQELKCDNSYFIVAKNNEQIVGFAGFKSIIDEADIMNIVVKKDNRKNGIGSLLLENLIYSAKNLNLKTLTLEVNEYNLPAISLYHNFGFEDVGIRKNYYNGTYNAIIMKKDI